MSLHADISVELHHQGTLVSSLDLHHQGSLVSTKPFLSKPLSLDHEGSDRTERMDRDNLHLGALGRTGGDGMEPHVALEQRHVEMDQQDHRVEEEVDHHVVHDMNQIVDQLVVHEMSQHVDHELNRELDRGGLASHNNQGRPSSILSPELTTSFAA